MPQNISCIEQRKIWNKTYYKKHKRQIKKQRQSSRVKLLKKGWDNTYKKSLGDEYKLMMKISNAKYYKTHKDQIKKRMKKYIQSENGKLKAKARIAKRHRKLGFVPIIDNPFPEEVKIEWHHINDLLVMPIPYIIHNNNRNGGNTEKHRKAIEPFINEFYGLDLGCVRA